MSLKLSRILTLFGLHKREFMKRFFFLKKAIFSTDKFHEIYSKIQPNDYLAVFHISSAISFTHPKHAISNHLIWRKNSSTIMQHNLIYSSLKIINTMITTYTDAVMCLFSFRLQLHPLPWK